MLQNLISFYFYFYFFDQELSFELETTLLRLKEKTDNSTPSTSNKCSSLTAIPVMLKFEENLLHLTKTDLNLTQIQRWIWEEQLIEIKIQRLCHGNPSMNSTTTPSTFN